jgi:hypothetical protein
VFTLEATRATARVALGSCAALPGLDPDDPLLLAPQAGAGVAAEPAGWDDPSVDWAGYDLVVLRSAWDYAARRDDFVAWAAGVPRLVNAPDVVTWNTDKRYLAELAAAGVPAVSTMWLGPDDTPALAASGEWVIKPAVSAGSRDTGRYDLGRPEHRALALSHLERLAAAGRVAMVQPYLPAVDTYGETALLFLDGEFSHAIRKGPMLDGPDTGEVGLYKEELITTRVPSDAELDVAARALAAVPGGADRLLYARVDLIPDPGGNPVVVELELTEPSLFLGYAEGAAERLAAAIVRRQSPASQSPARPSPT